VIRVSPYRGDCAAVHRALQPASRLTERADMFANFHTASINIL
jgi:hypothetical protein